ncbi:hypothetical protein DSM106972_048440 [Dulcicalothrix desertica PCC 7102]|uniref:Uncharacterized protein n=1 Tax=Dulcicalothrix desertica PCC 7102 TaxID=232991 RepID=A0A3S1CBF5_9CYAN|nr:hypothetical protein [Dulcicalothrix desertica]RUT03930.1 hypothetical protein DSM106972_048440 [Dulcicalothrix desertica PCC 7102]TWH43662.1 hypothetical protein CAL7102_07405 [Dulcicalothrix desertica PCC 7102]
MAWEEFERNGTTGVSGDEPVDEIMLALKRISTAYEDRFSRKPTVDEVLYALETVLTTHPSRYVSDTKGLKLGEIIIKPNDHEKGLDDIDTTQYEGVYTEATIPGYYVVLQRSPNEHNQSKTEIIKIPVLELEKDTLICKYEILKHDITDEMAQLLIKNVLLNEYCDNYYRNQANMIDFINLKFNTHHQILYK